MAPRSWLLVPADGDPSVVRALASDADALVFDLEDSVGIERKDRARALLRDHLAVRPADGPQRWVRINHSDPGLMIRKLGKPGDLGWVIQAHGEVYADEFGWDSSFEELVMKIVADYAGDHDEARQGAWIAESDGERVGCVFLIRDSDELARLRILLVHPGGRGRGVGDRLVSTCMDFAERVGYRRITLWTNDVLVAARRIYERHGFELVDQAYHHSFGHDLVGQNWARDL